VLRALFLGLAIAALTGCGLLDSGESPEAAGGTAFNHQDATQDCRQDTYEVLCAELYDINGYVRDSAGRPVPGVTIKKRGGDCIGAITDERGHYMIGNNAALVLHCVYPEMEGCEFTPSMRCYPDLNRNQYNQDFVIECTGDPAPHPLRPGQDFVNAFE
jgi:hypothetical protein